MKKIDFRTTAYFSGQMNILGAMLIFVGGFIALTNLIVGIIFLIFPLIIFTTHYRMNIDVEKKTYFDYVWFLGFKKGDVKKYECIEYLFFKNSTESQKVHSRVQSTTFKRDVVDAYLKFSEDHKVHLFTLDEREEVVEKLQVIAKTLDLKIVDYTSGKGEII